MGGYDMRDRAHLLRTNPRDIPLVRLFLPLSTADIVANETGGSLFIVPLDAYARSTAAAESACQVNSSDHGKCYQELNALFPKSPPDLALGDLIFYRPQLWHQTQHMIRGHRVSYVANLYDPDRLRDYYYSG